MSTGPQGPGWWPASDGRWYPPYPPPVRPKKSNTIWIALAFIGCFLLAGVGIGGYLIFRVVTGTTEKADVECPSGDFIGEQLRSPVVGPTDLDIVVVSGCYYSNEVYDVYVMSGITLATEDAQIESMISEGEAAGAEVRTIDIGDEGRVWASNTKGYAIAVGTDGLVSVEVEVKDASVPDLSDATVAILKRVLR